MPPDDTRANDTLDSILGDDHSSRFGSTVYVAAYFDGHVEVTGNGYARVAVANTTAQWPNAANRRKTNANDIEFPDPTGDYAQDVVEVAIHDHATAEAVIHSEELEDHVRPASGQPMLIPAEAINFFIGE